MLKLIPTIAALATLVGIYGALWPLAFNSKGPLTPGHENKLYGGSRGRMTRAWESNDNGYIIPLLEDIRIAPIHGEKPPKTFEPDNEVYRESIFWLATPGGIFALISLFGGVFLFARRFLKDCVAPILRCCGCSCFNRTGEKIESLLFSTWLCCRCCRSRNRRTLFSPNERRVVQVAILLFMIFSFSASSMGISANNDFTLAFGETLDIIYDRVLAASAAVDVLAENVEAMNSFLAESAVAVFIQEIPFIELASDISSQLGDVIELHDEAIYYDKNVRNVIVYVIFAFGIAVPIVAGVSAVLRSKFLARIVMWAALGTATFTWLLFGIHLPITAAGGDACQTGEDYLIALDAGETTGSPLDFLVECSFAESVTEAINALDVAQDQLNRILTGTMYSHDLVYSPTYADVTSGLVKYSKDWYVAVSELAETDDDYVTSASSTSCVAILQIDDFLYDYGNCDWITALVQELYNKVCGDLIESTTILCTASLFASIFLMVHACLGQQGTMRLPNKNIVSDKEISPRDRSEGSSSDNSHDEETGTGNSAKDLSRIQLLLLETLNGSSNIEVTDGSSHPPRPPGMETMATSQDPEERAIVPSLSFSSLNTGAPTHNGPSRALPTLDLERYGDGNLPAPIITPVSTPAGSSDVAMGTTPTPLQRYKNLPPSAALVLELGNVQALAATHVDLETPTPTASELSAIGGPPRYSGFFESSETNTGHSTPHGHHRTLRTGASRREQRKRSRGRDSPNPPLPLPSPFFGGEMLGSGLRRNSSSMSGAFLPRPGHQRTLRAAAGPAFPAMGGRVSSTGSTSPAIGAPLGLPRGIRRRSSVESVRLNPLPSPFAGSSVLETPSSEEPSQVEPSS